MKLINDMFIKRVFCALIYNLVAVFSLLKNFLLYCYNMWVVGKYKTVTQLVFSRNVPIINICHSTWVY